MKDKQKAIILPLIVFLINRVSLFFIVYLGLLIYPPCQGPELWRAFPHNLFLDGWARWDSSWYFSIVKHGYSYVPDQWSNIAFFPLYPLLIKIFNPIFKYLPLTGIVISNVCFLMSLIILYNIAKRKFGETVAFKTLLFFVLFPFSFFFSAAYSESLFLLLALLSFYYSEKNKWGIASFCAMLCSVTRVVGIALLPALLLKYLEKIKFDFRKIKFNVIYLFVIPMGILCYMFFLYVKFGDPLLFLKVQQTWERHIFNFSPHLYVLSHIPRNYLDILHLFNLVLTIFFGYLLWPVFRYLGISYAILSLSLIFIPFITGLESMGRYLSVVFPPFIIMGYIINNPKIYYSLSILFTILLIGFSIFFSHWGWVA